MPEIEIVRRHGLTALIGALGALIPVGTIFWFLVEPRLISIISVAVADDIKTQVQQEIRPLNESFKVLLKQDILDLKKDIANKEYRRDNPPEGDWTVLDAQRLVEDYAQLASLETALKELQ